jgi:uncharacterized protein (TIGR02284 family)
MTQDHEYAVSVFDNLVETTLDSVEGYQQAAELARNPRFKSVFQARTQARRRLAQELKDEVRSFGGKSLDNGSILGQAHRVFVALRDKIAGQSDRAIVEEVERSESVVRDRFQRAAHDEALPVGARQLVKRVYGSISDDYDKVSAMKDEFR